MVTAAQPQTPGDAARVREPAGPRGADPARIDRDEDGGLVAEP
jgi:hypothetical protein